MLYGGHVKDLEDLEFLQNQGFELGEVIFGARRNGRYWVELGIREECRPGFLLIAHGPQEGPPNDIAHLWNSYYVALESTIQAAAEMGIAFLTVHLWMDPRFVKPEVRKEKTKALKEIVRIGHRYGVVISLENLSESAADLVSVLEAVPDLSLTMDVGHGQLLTRLNTAFGIIRELSSAIRHVHLHDNRGGTGVKDDLHLAIGQGIIDFQAILGALIESGYDGTATLELERIDLVPSREEVRRMVNNIERPT
jgi:sugar phosphate isomerase/epimerase